MRYHRKMEFDKSTIGALAKGFKNASDVIRMKNPDYIFAPVAGAVPFVDILNIVDRKFPLDAVKYLPNSSRFANRDELVSRWYENFYEKNEVGGKMKILCLDEVISGTSAVNSYYNFKKSVINRAAKKAGGMEKELEAREFYEKKLNNDIDFEIIGIAEKRYDRNPAFGKLVNQKKVYVIEFDKVPTIDNINLNPIRFKEKEKNCHGRITYLPKIEEFVVTPDYLSFLQNIATYIGVDPSNVKPIEHASKIEEGLRQATE